MWRATTRFVTDAKLLGWKSELVEQGPLWKLYRVRFQFDGDRFYELELKMVADHPYAYVTERNNFRLRIAELPHPLCGRGGHMAHGKCYTRWGVADQLRILMKENFDPDICYTPETFSYGFARDPLKHDAVKVWTAIRPVFPWTGPWLGTYSTDEKKKDLIAIVGRDAAHWEYPDSSIHSVHLTPGLHAEIHSGIEPPPLERVVDHIDRVVELAGIDHVGLGSDFDGVTSLPRGLEDCSKLPALTRALLDRGYPEAAVIKILGGNFLRVFREVERVAEDSGGG